RWLIKAFDLWPSVSNVHFSDVFITHPAFQAVETLFDYGVLEAIGVSPRWSEAGGYAEKNDGFDHRKSNFGPFYPEKTDFNTRVECPDRTNTSSWCGQCEIKTEFSRSTIYFSVP